MLNKKLYLNPDALNSRKVEQKHTRDGFGEGLLAAGGKDENIVVLTADLKDSTRVNLFADAYPKRFIEVGVAEQALASIASGMANYGKIPFISSYAIFSPGRNWEQIRTTIGIDGYPVKIIGAQAGLNIGHYGVTHQGLEDIALARVIPGMTVLVPLDYEEAKKATEQIAKLEGPVYMRLNRAVGPVITTSKTPFKIGNSEVLWSGKDPKVTIIGSGPILYEALLAAKELLKVSIDVMVVNCHTVKPLDELGIIRSAKTTGAVVTLEEHQVMGGLGSAISEVLSKNFPVPMEMLGVQDRYGQSGEVKELYEEYGLTKKDVIISVKKLLSRRGI
ncbi:transketolase family protein [Candidatus Microgenomates bacterium]|nr:transketolase family protein [Candidatus Microgenomates bacterium]